MNICAVTGCDGTNALSTNHDLGEHAVQLRARRPRRRARKKRYLHIFPFSQNLKSISVHFSAFPHVISLFYFYVLPLLLSPLPPRFFPWRSVESSRSLDGRWCRRTIAAHHASPKRPAPNQSVPAPKRWAPLRALPIINLILTIIAISQFPSSISVSHASPSHNRPLAARDPQTPAPHHHATNQHTPLTPFPDNRDPAPRASQRAPARPCVTA